LKNLRNAIFSKNAGSALDTLIAGQIFYGKAPTGTRYPYVIFFRVSGGIEKTFTEEYDTPLIQFSVFSADPNSSNEVHEIADAIKATYDECSLSITGSTLVWMRLQNDIGPMEDDSISQDGADGGWAAHLDFDVRASLN